MPPLSRQELQILLMLLQAHGQVVTHEALGTALWGENWVDTNAVSQAIYRLRRKLGDAGAAVVNVPNSGYRWDEAAGGIAVACPLCGHGL